MNPPPPSDEYTYLFGITLVSKQRVLTTHTIAQLSSSLCLKGFVVRPILQDGEVQLSIDVKQTYTKRTFPDQVNRFATYPSLHKSVVLFAPGSQIMSPPRSGIPWESQPNVDLVVSNCGISLHLNFRAFNGAPLWSEYEITSEITSVLVVFDNADFKCKKTFEWPTDPAFCGHKLLSIPALVPSPPPIAPPASPPPVSSQPPPPLSSSSSLTTATKSALSSSKPKLLKQTLLMAKTKKRKVPSPPSPSSPPLQRSETKTPIVENPQHSESQLPLPLSPTPPPPPPPPLPLVRHIWNNDVNLRPSWLAAEHLWVDDSIQNGPVKVFIFPSAKEEKELVKYKGGLGILLHLLIKDRYRWLCKKHKKLYCWIPELSKINKRTSWNYLELTSKFCP
jgi:hypothetical protein